MPLWTATTYMNPWELNMTTSDRLNELCGWNTPRKDKDHGMRFSQAAQNWSALHSKQVSSYKDILEKNSKNHQFDHIFKLQGWAEFLFGNCSGSFLPLSMYSCKKSEKSLGTFVGNFQRKVWPETRVKFPNESEVLIKTLTWFNF